MSSLKENPKLPNDGMRWLKKPMSEREKAERFGEILKPLPPSLGKRKKAKRP